MLLPMLFLSLYEAYAILVRQEPLHRPLLEMGLMAVGSFIVAQTTFSIIFRLCKRNQQQQARLAALHQVDLNLSMSLDQEQVVRAVLEGGLRLIQGQIARALVYDPEREGFESGWEYTDGDQYRSIDCKPPSDGFDARVIATREIQLVKDVTAPGSLPAFSDAAHDIRAAVGIPLLHNNQMLGILDIGFDAPRTFGEDELETLRLLGTRAAAALDNARLFGDAVGERERTRTLLETIETLGTTLRLDRLLERALNGLQQVIPHNAASINLVRDQVCWSMASRGQVCISSERFLLAEFPQMRRVIQERTPVIISDTHAESHIFPVESPGPVRAWMGVPLMSKDEVTGVLTVESHQPDAYDEDMARFALVFARQVALAIENSRLYEQTRAQLREATLLHGVMVALASTLDVDQILPYMARSLCEILNAACAEIYSLDEESGAISIIAHHIDIETELAKAPESDQVYALADYPAAAEALNGRHPTQVRTTAPETSPHNLAMLEAHGAKATLILPMIARDCVLGFAQVWETQISRRFTEAEIAVAQTLIHPASIAMENARLFGEIQHRMREIQLLHDVGLAAASGLRLEETLQAAVKALAVGLEGSRVAIMLLDPDGQELHLEASVGLPPDVVKDVRIGIGEGIMGWVAENREAVLVPDVHKDPRYIELAPGTRSELCVPLTTGSAVIGVLNVESAQPAAYAEDDQRLLSILASNLTVLIERARLFEEVEAAKSELQSRAEALEEANVRLHELDQLKLQFLARVSHELRTPLNSIIGFSEVLLEGTVGEMTSQMKECVQIILTNGEHLLTLINDILDLSRIDAGRVELYLSTFSAGELLEEAAETIRPMVEKKSQVLSVDQAEGIPPVTGDRFRIKQVLLNLLSNANKFTPESGSIALTCRLADPETMLFSVSDDGIGIGTDDQKILFEDFRQVDGSVTRKASGAGLGLAISKRLVEMHGGRIWVKSSHEQGATFSFILPLDGPPHLTSE